MNKKFCKLISYCLALAGLENSVIAMESFPAVIEKRASDANSTHGRDDAKERRYSRYDYLSKHLEKLNDESISTLLEQGTSLHSGWGSSVKLEIDGMPVFVKKVPLNEIEGRPENMRSTENLFDIPLYYQYGVGSGGFSIWREISAHIMSTEWVLADEHENLPLMYHWRILNKAENKAPLDEEEKKLC